MNEQRIRVQLQPVWSTVREVRNRVLNLLEDLPEGTRAASAMVAAELLENSIKYGESVAEAPQIDFSFEWTQSCIRITVSNGASDGENVRRLLQRVREMADAEDKAILYMRRLEELMENPTQETGLGIYRVGFEGNFDLSVTYQSEVVTVVATRSIA
jgi:hypothetical protein